MKRRAIIVSIVLLIVFIGCAHANAKDVDIYDDDYVKIIKERRDQFPYQVIEVTVIDAQVQEKILKRFWEAKYDLVDVVHVRGKKAIFDSLLLYFKRSDGR